MDALGQNERQIFDEQMNFLGSALHGAYQNFVPTVLMDFNR